LLFLALAAGFLGWVVRSRWEEFRAGARSLSVGPVLGAGALAFVGVGASMFAWRSLLTGLGSPLGVRPSARIYFVGQLGKYVPGGIWPILAQAELAADQHVPRRRSIASYGLLLALTVASGGAVGAIALAFSDVDPLWEALAAVGAVAAMSLSHPRMVSAMASRLSGTPVVMPGAWIARALVWCTTAWVAFGLQTYVVVRGLGAGGWRALAVAVAGFSLAWIVGLLVIVAPAGAGAREGVLIAVLSIELPLGRGAVVAIVVRFLMTVADLVAGGLGLAARRRATPGPSGASTPLDRPAG
jgi:hypothetical protein